ncbi:MAG: cytochrome c oxidase subunit II [Gammaproteobacteria bacterium]|nr:cytochrome c oxidase subunit II [Gammaproteobacteria bacterium]
MHNYISRLTIFISTFFIAVAAQATPGINMPYGVTPISNDIYNLHMACFYVCCVIGAGVFGVLIYSLIKYRKSNGAKAALFHEHIGVEMTWTIIPTLILIALAIPATIVLKHIHNTDESGLTIKVTGYQWKWKYEYLDQGISFFSNLSTPQDQINNLAPKNEWYLLEVDNPVVVPVDTKVKLLVTADDVIHDWWVPELGVKQDAIPGFINENWFLANKIGTYRGQCGELCGVNHAFMPIVVEVVSKADFEKWVKSHGSATFASSSLTAPTTNAKPAALMTEADLMKLGKEQYEKTCAMCHQVTGLGLPPTFPALKGSSVVTGPLSAEDSLVIHGKKGTAMQAFGDQLDDKTLAAVITYTRHAWGNEELNKKNKYPTTIQPQDIAKARK